MLQKAFKIIIVTEKFISHKICKMIEQSGARGFTLVPAGGKGKHHVHDISSKASLIDDFTNIKIEVIIKDRQLAEDIVDKVIAEFFDNYSGIIYIEGVEIHRLEKF